MTEGGTQRNPTEPQGKHANPCPLNQNPLDRRQVKLGRLLHCVGLFLLYLILLSLLQAITRHQVKMVKKDLQVKLLEFIEISQLTHCLAFLSHNTAPGYFKSYGYKWMYSRVFINMWIVKIPFDYGIWSNMRKQAQILLLVIIPRPASGYRLLRDATLNISCNCLWMIIYARIKQKNTPWPINVRLGLTCPSLLWALACLKAQASHTDWLQKDVRMYSQQKTKWLLIRMKTHTGTSCPQRKTSLPPITAPKMVLVIDGSFWEC